MTTAALVDSIAVALTAGQHDILGELSSDLRFLLCENEVPDQVQILLHNKGYKNMTMFSVFADDRAALRTIIRTEIVNPAEAGLTAAQSSSASLIVNQLVASWMAATQKTAEDVRVTADAKALRLPAMISRTHLIALRKRFETDNGRVPDSIFPCAALLEKRFEEIEEGILTAQPLSEIISVELSVGEHTEIDLGSNVRVRKAPKAIAIPNTTEVPNPHENTGHFVRAGFLQTRFQSRG